MAKFITTFGDDDLVSDEVFIARLRHWRDRELAATDWTQLPDSPCDRDAYADYRQALRDLPNNFDGNREIELPSKP